MKVIDLDQEKPTLKEILEMAAKENLVLKTPEGREFVLAETEDFDREVALVRENEALMKVLKQRSTEKNAYTLTQAKEILQID